MEDKEKLYFEIESSEEFINSKSEYDLEKDEVNSNKLSSISKNVIFVGIGAGLYALIKDYNVMGILSIIKFFICIYISYIAKVVINELITITDKINKN
ncbi:hypothetical protein [Clostridium tertium]|uniref:hypothetical protein n=1 Tax=Clostridium tertium TaxID=1559 RepID=UPI001AE51B87|nr:hypothetical protein [Clostridium tertium]MBP1869832.1 hypothetical protein [Clostridium tertium]